MPGTVYIFHPWSDAVETHILEEAPKLDYLKGAVGGYIQAVPYFSTYLPPDGGLLDCIVFCNEDGKRLDLPVNLEATRLWDRALRRVKRGGRYLYPTGIFDPQSGDPSDVLVGSVIVLTGDTAFMRSLVDDE
jgi:Domain of unknown function (DUF3846)